MPKRYESLDGLRGMCALVVAVFHLGRTFDIHWFDHAYLCVDVFFVISGFVIAMRYEERLGAGLGMAQFLRARARRLLPALLFGTALVSAVALLSALPGIAHTLNAGIPDIAIAAVLGLLLIPSFSSYSPHIFPLNSVVWSLWCEWLVNALYAGLLFRLKARGMSIAIALIWAGLAVIVFAGPRALDVGTRQADFSLGLIRASAGFLAGAGVWRLHALGRLKLPAVHPLIIYTVLLLATSVPATIGTTWFDFAAAIGAILAVGSVAGSARKIPAPLLWLGAISYPLYVSHYTLVWIGKILLGGHRAPADFALPFAAIGASLLLAWAIEQCTRPQRARRDKLVAQTSRENGTLLSN